jgi:hypothetical protein
MRTLIKTFAPLSGRLACLNVLTGTMQILHSFPRGEPLPLAMALTPTAARAHYPPPQVSHIQQHLLPASGAAPSTS